MIHIGAVEMDIVLGILEKHIQNGYAVVFGSRYEGNVKDYSDLDLAIAKHDQTSFTWKEVADLKESFEESDLNFRVDVIDYWETTKEFRQIIDKGCFRIYEHI